MSISNRIEEALAKLQLYEYENALIQICIALDATAKKEYPGKGSAERMKSFIKDNIAFITRVAYGKLEIQGNASFQLADTKIYSFEEVLYKIVRCTLLHEAELGSLVEIINKNQIGSSGEGKFLLSVGLIQALLFSVITANSNSNIKLNKSFSISIDNKQICISELFGKKDFYYQMVKEINLT